MSVVALLAATVLSGAAAAVIAGAFLWLVDVSTDFLWTDLPKHVGVAPYSSWWLFAVPIFGGILVGIGQTVFGNYPQPIQDMVVTWRAGGHVEPKTMPATTFNTLAALATGGPVGFEAALAGLIGGAATLVSRRIHRAGHLVRQAFGAERIDSLPHRVRTLPYWLAALAGLLTFHALPFGHPHEGFRFSQWNGALNVPDALIGFAFAAVVTVPIAWAVSVVTWAEGATYFKRSPIVAGVAGAVVFATMAIPSHYLLFSGQPGYQHLIGLSNATLAYLTVAKWAALVVALVAGWRGGPIFPSLFAIGALGVLVHDPLGVPPQLLMVAGGAAVSAVFLKGRIPAAFVLTLYIAPLSYAGIILIGAVGGATALAIAGSLGVLPTSADEPSPPDADTDAVEPSPA